MRDTSATNTTISVPTPIVPINTALSNALEHLYRCEKLAYEIKGRMKCHSEPTASEKEKEGRC